MNSYFKNPAEVALLFQHGLEALAREGWHDGCALDLALRHDPYNPTAHDALAMYQASQQRLNEFRHHVRICYNLDATCLERILVRDAVVRAFSAEDLLKVREWVTYLYGETTPVKLFSPLEPAAGEVVLSIRKGFHEEIGVFYHALPEHTARYFHNDVPYDESNPIFTAIDVDEFALVHYFQLEYHTDRDYVNSPPEQLYGALKAISPYIHDIRFFILDESPHVDEVIVREGVFYFYRHVLDHWLEHGSFHSRVQHLETLAHQHRDEVLRQWLRGERLDHVLGLIEYQLPKGLSEAAQLDIDAFIASVPADDPSLPYIHGKLLLQQGDLKNGIAYLKQSIEQNFFVFDVCYELGKLQVLQIREWEESIHHFTLALGVKNYTDIYLYRALAYLHLGQEVQADSDLAEYIAQIQPFNNSALGRGGMFLAEAGFNAQARKLLLAALEKNQVYDDELRAKWEQAPNDQAFYSHHVAENKARRGNFYMGLGNCTPDRVQALAYAQQALAFDEGDVAKLYNMGVILQDLQRTAEAEAYYDRALAVDGTYIKALNNKSAIRFGQQDYTAALALTDQILALDQEYAEAMNTKAGCLFHRGDLWGALELYRHYTARKPAVATGHFGMGFILAHLRQDMQAIPHLEKAVGLSPAGAPQLHEIYTSLANCYNNTGALTKALEACERSIALKSTYYHPYYIKACVLHKQGHDDDALAMARKAVACDSSQRNLILHEPDLAGMRDKLLKTL